MPYYGLGDAHEASLYRTLVRDLPEYAIFRIGLNGLIESWNTGVERVLGYNENEFVGMAFAHLFTQQDRDRNSPEQEMKVAAERGRASDVRWHLRKNGDRFFCDGVLTPIHDQAGNAIAFTKVMHDITRRKMAEQQTTELARALDLTHTIIREMDGTVVLWTQGAEFLYGWSREEAVGRRTHDLLRTQFREPLSMINHRLSELGEWQGELEHKTKDGRTVVVASHWILHSRLDNGTRVIEVNNDVTKLEAMQEQLETLNQGLQRANAELTSFAYEVAHDIQAPIRGVTALTELLSSKLRGIASEQDRALLNSIVESGRKLRNLVDSLLQYATVQNTPEDIEPFALNDIVDEVQTNLADVIAESGADLSWEQMPVIRAHRVRILRLLQNVVSNAIKYARPSVRPVIRISAKRTGEEWRIDVEDNGTGIPEKQVETIFAPLTRLHGAEIPGVGLGLAICKRIAEGEGGRIWADSVVGQGSVFHIALPANADKPQV